MNILVPFVRLHPATEAAAMAAAAGCCVSFVPTRRPGAYLEALRGEWNHGTFIVLEQDKVPETGLLQQLWDCPQPWCTVETATRGGNMPARYPSLSCTKFDIRLAVDYPTLMADVAGLDLGFGAGEWSRLDMAIAGLLISRGWSPHYHPGTVLHLHDSHVDVATYDRGGYLRPGWNVAQKGLV